MIAGNSRAGTKKAMNESVFYDTQVEIFMALREVDRSYYLGKGPTLVSSTSIPPQNIVLFWKPPGALQWVEKCRTELVQGKMNLQFTNKAYLKFDRRDMSSIHLKFFISNWSSVETTMDKIVMSGPKGLILPLTLLLDIGRTQLPSYVEECCRNAMPGALFLRAEILQPAYLGFHIQCDSRDEYYVELYKINQGNILELPNAYTLIYRSCPNSTDSYAQPVYFQEPRITNGDDERILKFEVYKKKSFAKKGFALTTLADLYQSYDGFYQVALPVDQFQVKTKKRIKIIVKLGQQVTLQPLEYYQNVGLRMLRVYAVDFSRSNSDTFLHKRGLHDNDGGMSPYEEALELVAIVTMEISAGESVFYSFGDVGSPYVATFPEENHLKSLVETYQNASVSSRMSSMQLLDDPDEIQSTDDGACLPSSSHFCSANYSKGKTLIKPLMEEITALISTRNIATFNLDNHFEYYTVFILTDGQISDVEKAIEVLIELGNLPVSLIFIGIGQGDFHPLIALENSWIEPIHGKFICRKFVHVVHFRSIFEWTSSLKYYKVRSDPIDIFRKEILTALREHALSYMRAFLPKV